MRIDRGCKVVAVAKFICLAECYEIYEMKVSPRWLVENVRDVPVQLLLMNLINHSVPGFANCIV